MYGPDVDALPMEFRSVLTEQDVAAIRTGPGYFANLAGTEAPQWLREVLAGCAATNCELQFHSAGDSPYRPYFRFHWQGQPAISLPRQKPLRPDLPAFLRTVYGVIGSFRESGFDIAGGMYAGDALRPVSETGIWVQPGGPIDPAEAVPFLERHSGSLLCYLPDGKGAWLKACQFRPVDDLEGEVARYFGAILKD